MEKEICWNITDKCNQNCHYCHRFLNVGNLSFEENKQILDNLISSGVTCITWTGGEALMIDGIDELLRISNAYGIKNKLITNGKLLSPSRIDKIYRYLDSITLSIDSTDNKINDSLGRGYNHFENIKSILNYIMEKKYAVKIRINSVVCKQNLNGISKLTTFLNKYDIYSWRIFKFMPLRETALSNQEDFEVSMDEYTSVLDYIFSNSNCDNLDTRTIEDMEKKYILILADGSIVVTENDSDKILGNALTHNILNIFQQCDIITKKGSGNSYVKTRKRN